MIKKKNSKKILENVTYCGSNKLQTLKFASPSSDLEKRTWPYQNPGLTTSGSEGQGQNKKKDADTIANVGVASMLRNIGTKWGGLNSFRA